MEEWLPGGLGALEGLVGCVEGTPADVSGQQDCGGHAPASLCSLLSPASTVWVLGTELRSWEQGMSVPACYTISVATVSFLQEKNKNNKPEL